jgi:hypothetical protein
MRGTTFVILGQGKTAVIRAQPLKSESIFRVNLAQLYFN